ncbi:MAG: hypothetical protein HUK20_11150 [Fibrobacter sp.]|nr:hypothetical protein [Fibrobacter sp.]
MFKMCVFVDNLRHEWALPEDCDEELKSEDGWREPHVDEYFEAVNQLCAGLKQRDHEYLQRLKDCRMDFVQLAGCHTSWNKALSVPSIVNGYIDGAYKWRVRRLSTLDKLPEKPLAAREIAAKISTTKA